MSPENDVAGAFRRDSVPNYNPGGMTERTKVLVLKTSEAQASVGSNPTPSAKNIDRLCVELSLERLASHRIEFVVWSDAGEVGESVREAE